MMGADLFIATAIDPMFLVLPALAVSRASKGSEDRSRLFLSSDDHFDRLPEESSHLAEILRWEKTRTLIEGRMSAICDTVEAGDESMFRLNEARLLTTIIDKAKRMSDGGLPPSMEDKFVKTVLEAPTLLQKRDTPVKEVQASEGAESEVSTPRTESTNSQSTAMSLASQPSTPATSFTGDELAADTVMNTVEASPDIVKLQRLRVAFDFICSSYISAAVAEQLRQQLPIKDASSVDFSPLDKLPCQGCRATGRSSGHEVNSIGLFSKKRARRGTGRGSSRKETEAGRGQETQGEPEPRRPRSQKGQHERNEEDERFFQGEMKASFGV